MATFSNIDGEESATVTFTVAAVSLTRNSSAELQELLTLADSDVATNVARVMPSAPVSTHAGLVVRIASGPSTLTDLAVRAVLPSTATDTPITAHGNQSSNSSVYLPVRLTNGTAFLTPGTDYPDGTTASNLAAPALTFDNGTNATMRIVGITQGLPVNIVSGTAAIIVRSSAANSLHTVYQSTAADLQVTASQNSTAWSVLARNTTSSGGGVEGSTTTPAQGVIGLHVREVPSSMQTAVASTVGATSTNTVLVSSAANQIIKVYAYSITSTVITNSTVSFRSSLANVEWPVVLGSGSSGVVGANLAVNPPAFLFKTVSANALTFHTPSSGPEFHVAVSYFV